MAVSRRAMLGWGGGLAAAAMMTGLAGCGGGAAGSGGDGTAALRFTWWGNPVRDKATADVIAAYQNANAGITITGEPAEPSGYWDRLATQAAANDLPDLIQMDEKYIREYGDRGALLDLDQAGLDVSGLGEGVAEAGVIGGTRYGVSGGTNTLTMLANPAVFEAVGIEMPDDTTWTWDDLTAMVIEISRAGGGEIFGSGSLFGNESMLGTWLRQNGANLFGDEGLAFTAEQVVPYFEMVAAFMAGGAMPSASVLTEESAKSLAEGMFATGKTAFAVAYSNQVKAFDSASGQDIAMLRMPSIAGQATQREAWYKASLYWTAAARGEYAEQSVAFINYLINSPEAGGILLTERGLTPNTDVLAAIQDKLDAGDKKVAAFMAEIEPEVTAPPPPPVVGGGRIQDVLTRHVNDQIQGTNDAATTATNFVAEMTAEIGS